MEYIEAEKGKLHSRCKKQLSSYYLLTNSKQEKMVLKNSNTDSLETLARLKLRQSSKPEADRYFTARSRFSILPIISWTEEDDDHW